MIDIELLYSKEEIVKSFIEDVEAVKDLLPKTKENVKNESY